MKTIKPGKSILLLLVIAAVLFSVSLFFLFRNKDQTKESVSVPKASASDNSNIITKIPPVNTNLVENKKALKLVSSTHAKENEVYRWTVEKPNGTIYYFGLQEKGGIRPIVKMRNKEGWFVRYEPHTRINADQNADYAEYVQPKVDGNSIEWRLPNGIVAKYTSLGDKIKADYIVKSRSILCHSGLPRISKQKDSGVVVPPPQNDDCKNTKLDFTVQYNDSYAGDTGEGLKDGRGYLKHDLLPDGSITWLAENGSEVFSFPKPVIQEEIKNQKSKIQIKIQKLKIQN